jgi:ABC-type transport system involved in cytochrome c biogenesis ATPase subunit
MDFYVVASLNMLPPGRRNVAYLEIDNWNDWGQYRTQYFLSYMNAAGALTKIGSVKIGEKGLVADRPGIPGNFSRLQPQFFSLGQSREYYQSLMELPREARDDILVGLRDIVHDRSILDPFINEDVTQRSLFRDFSVALVDGQFRRILQGRPVLTNFFFNFTRPATDNAAVEPLSLDFSVEPSSNPPTNIHALIGRNGVGKTDFLIRMVRALIRPNDPERQGKFSFMRANQWIVPDSGREVVFSNLIVVAFSVFDPFSTIEEEDRLTIKYLYIGLRPPESQEKTVTDGHNNDPIQMMRESFPIQFVRAIERCHANKSLPRLTQAFQNLRSDRILADWNFPNLAEDVMSENGRAMIQAAFSNLSSGHKIVCLTIAQLVAYVSERSLVLIDEPESHLHPPLLAALIRTISELLVDQNGVAVIATHSPVVLQEVPKECVWILDKSGTESKAERPLSETFGENVGTLTRDVFQLEVLESGFHKLIEEAASKHVTYEDALAEFHGNIGSEARVILRSIFESRKPK